MSEQIDPSELYKRGWKYKIAYKDRIDDPNEDEKVVVLTYDSYQKIGNLLFFWLEGRRFQLQANQIVRDEEVIE